MRSGLRLQGSTFAVVTLVAVAAVVNVAPATAGAGNPVKVIVNFHQPVGAASLAAVEQAGGNVRHRYRLIAAVSATLPQQAIGALGRHPLVESVELDHEVALFHHGPSTGNPELEAAWGVEHIGAGQVHQAGNTGSGVKVGVIDTGIDYTHPDLDSVYAGGWDFFNDDPDPFDDQGHGTHVSGSIAAELNVPPAGVVGVAPSARLYAYKVLGADGRGDYSGVIAALEQAALVDRVDVVNMSLGGREVSTALENAVAAAYAAGVILVAAAGNVNPANFFELLFGCPVAYPAKYPQVFATTFTGQNNELTGYSCTGPEVDFAAPGDQVNSTVPTGSCPFCAPSGYRSLSGTSMASPHLAGTVALVLSHGIANTGDPATRADDVKAHLCATTMPGFGVLTTPIPETDPRYAQYFGCGVVDARNALLDNPPGSGGGGGGSDDPDPTPTPTPTPSPTPTSTPSPTSQPSPEPPPQTIHVADLSGSATRQGNGWTARVTILVHDTEHTALSGVTVSGSWSTGAVGSCRSNGSGLCTISLSKLPTSLAGVTLSVTDLVRSGWTYAAADNHDADGDSDGTTIEVLRP